METWPTCWAVGPDGKRCRYGAGHTHPEHSWQETFSRVRRMPDKKVWLIVVAGLLLITAISVYEASRDQTTNQIIDHVPDNSGRIDNCDAAYPISPDGSSNEAG